MTRKGNLSDILSEIAGTDSPKEEACSLFGKYCQEMRALTRGLELPEAFKSPDARKTGDEFDVMQYFKVLDHLSMEPGCVLDYFYVNFGGGGRPVLYARLET
jgi:hypothetical protein